MTFKKLLIIMTVAFTAVIIMLLGTSYAWYQFDYAVTSFDVQTSDNDTDLSVVFTSNDKINTNIGVPIFASEVESKSSKSTFTIRPSSAEIGDRDIAFQISLIDIKLDEILTSVDSLKYSLIEEIDGSSKTVASGNFKNFSGESILLKPSTKVASSEALYKPDKTYSYEFRIWLEDNGCTIKGLNEGTCSSQNDLMGKNISGKIKVSVFVR